MNILLILSMLTLVVACISGVNAIARHKKSWRIAEISCASIAAILMVASIL